MESNIAQKINTGATQEAQITEIYNQAKKAKLAMDTIGKSLQKELGAKYIDTPLKAQARTVKKSNTKLNGDLSKLTDVARGSLVCDSYEDMLSIADKLDDRFSIVNKVDTVKKPVVGQMGFRNIKLLVNVENHISEIQIQLKDMYEVAQGKGHELYEKQRNIEFNTTDREWTKEEATEINDIKQQSIALYDEVIDKYNQRTPGVKIKTFHEAIQENKTNPVAKELNEKLDGMKNADVRESVNPPTQSVAPKPAPTEKVQPKTITTPKPPKM